MALRDPGKTIPSLGFHTRGMYVSLFGRLVREGSSGALTVQLGGSYHRLFFMNGSPVWFESSEPSLSLPDHELENLEARMMFVKRGIEAPLQWEKGGWTFEPSDGLPASLLLKAAFLDSSPLKALWAGVRKSLRQFEVLGPIADRTAGPVVPQPALTQGWAALEVEGPLAELLSDLERPASVPELLRAYAHQHQDFFKMLWLLEALGWVTRDGNRNQALGLTPPLDDPFGGDQVMSFAESLNAAEPDSREFDLPQSDVSESDTTVPPEQVLDTIRSEQVSESPHDALTPSDIYSELDIPLPETATAPEPLLNEWNSGHAGAQRTPTAPSDVRPDLRSSRPSSQAPDSTGSYIRSNAASTTPTPERKPASPRAPSTRTTGTTPNSPKSPTLRRSHSSRPGSAPALLSATAVICDYRSRMGTDYYKFLGVPAKANHSVIERAWTRLLARWTTASKNRHLPEDVRQMARELAQVTHLAGRTFSVPSRRQEYDRRMDRGQAPLAGGIPAARVKNLPKTNPEAGVPRPPLDKVITDARALVASGEFPHAVALLKSLRLRNPSDPDVLSELGWAVWKASDDTERSEAEEYLQLATTFNPRHVRSREFLARIALDTGDNEAAYQRLERLLTLQPDAGWAQAALARLPTPEDEKSGVLRLAFWKK